jgi:N6-adenosine-specific RNA methylase IME4
MKKKSGKTKSLAGKFQVIVADPPWQFQDRLTMSDVKRGAAANYPTLTTGIMSGFPISQLAAEDALLALWVPSALLEDGMRLMAAWGFKHKAIYTWVKTGKATKPDDTATYEDTATINVVPLAFGMGRYFRGVTEHALIGVRGKAAALVQSHSERGAELSPALPHSAKPDGLQVRLERMFKGEKLELFARRERKGWTCVGNEVGEKLDIRDWLQAALPARKVA